MQHRAVSHYDELRKVLIQKGIAEDALALPGWLREPDQG
jgi:hypothetical protein